MLRVLRITLSCLLLGSAWGWDCAVPSARAQDAIGPFDDPVEDLRQALMDSGKLGPLPDPADPNFPKELEHHKIVKEFRRTTLTRKIDALKTVQNLRRGLMLPEWREDLLERPDVGNDPMAEIRQIDAEIRIKLANMFKKAIRTEVKKGSATRRLAIARMIAAIPPTMRAPGADETIGFTRELTPEVLDLADDADIGVRQQGLATLSVIHPDSKKAVSVYQKVLREDTPRFRLLAAQGLRTMMDVVNTMRHAEQRGAARQDHQGGLAAHRGGRGAGLRLRPARSVESLASSRHLHRSDSACGPRSRVSGRGAHQESATDHRPAAQRQGN